MSRQEMYPTYGWPPPKRSAVGTFFKCCAAVAITGILCGTGIVTSTVGMGRSHIGEVLSFANKALRDLPGTLRESAPALADALNDRRDPGYVQSIELAADAPDGSSRLGSRAVIEVRNSGEDVVSVLAIRAVYLDRSGRPMGERIVYGATPLALEGEWRGPLFPGVKRKIAVHCPSDAAKVALEITELRVWQPDEGEDDSATDGAASSSPRADAAPRVKLSRAG